MRPLRILYLTPYVPSRLRTRPYHLLKGLAERGHRIVLVSAATSARERSEAAALTPFCERVRTVPISLGRSLWNCCTALVAQQPLQARFCRSAAMTDAVREALSAAGGYDVLHVEHLRAVSYADAIPALPRVYDAVDCMSRLFALTAASGPTWSSRVAARIDLPATRRLEPDLVRRFDRVLLSAATEREALLELSGAAPDVADAATRVRVLSNGVDLEYFAPQPVRRDPATLVFVGRMAYHANLAAAHQLVTEILPRLWQRRPAVRLLIVGADPPAALRRLVARAGARVELTGYVVDVRPYLARATVSVNPLRYTVGVQNKILEAMAMATPVVATPAACTALGARDGEHLLIGERSDDIAAAVAGLLDDPGLAGRIGAAGRQYVEAAHDWQRVAAELEAVYRDAIAAHAPAARTQNGVGAQ